MRGKVKAYGKSVFCILAGSVLISVSVSVFTAPNDIAPGGMIGISTMLNYLWGFPIGMSVLVLNIPLFILGWRAFGGVFLAKTIAATVVSSIIMDMLSAVLPAYRGDMLLVTVFGGICAGAGLGLVFMCGATTGGTDLAARLLKRRFRHISLGRLMLGIDFGIVLLSAFVYRSYETPLYAVLVIFITGKVIDALLYGFDSGNGKLMFIVSDKSDEIAKDILKKVGRGVTLLQARGAYRRVASEVLMCAVWRQELYKTYDVIYAIDPQAFIVVGDAGEISGEGFKKIEWQPKSNQKPKKS